MLRHLKKIVKSSSITYSCNINSSRLGITEPLEFTFLFIAPYLFVLHAVLAASMDTLMYAFGVVGNMGGGLLDFISTNWLPLGKEHWGTYVASYYRSDICSDLLLLIQILNFEI